MISIAIKQTNAHSAMDKPANFHKTTEQSPVPLKIMGNAWARGNVSTTNPRSAPQSKISGGLCSSHVCRRATPAPNPEKRMISQFSILEKTLFEEIGNETRARIPMIINAYLWRIHIGQGASPSLCWRNRAKAMSPEQPRNSALRIWVLDIVIFNPVASLQYGFIYRECVLPDVPMSYLVNCSDTASRGKVAL